MNRKRDPAAAGSLRFSIYGIALDYGKEDGYERNPGGVSFVFNEKISELFSVLKSWAACQKLFDRLRDPAAAGSLAAFSGSYRFFS